MGRYAIYGKSTKEKQRTEAYKLKMEQPGREAETEHGGAEVCPVVGMGECNEFVVLFCIMLSMFKQFGGTNHLLSSRGRSSRGA